MKRRQTIAIAACLIAAVPVAAEAQVTASGRITMLRVHDVGTAYGPPSDRIDVEVVTTLDTQPGRAFGFQLRQDSNQAARQGMLDLLRDAYANNQRVSFDHITPPGKNNGRIIRVWLSR
jgi:hypothetical protein